jgi:RNA polymerase sigma-70 factor (ECF subfamily)
LVQGFFERLLGNDWLAQVDRHKGRFRSFLLASLKHFVSNEWDKARALKRGAGQRIISTDQLTAEARYGLEPSHTETPDHLYERRWALMLLDRVLERLKAEHASEGKSLMFEELKGTLEAGRDVPYADIAHRLGVSVGSVKVIVHRLRRRYRELLRDEIAQTVGEPSQVDQELRNLVEVLRR